MGGEEVDELRAELLVVPNPSRGRVRVSGPFESEEVLGLQVLDLTGRSVWQGRQQAGTNIDVAFLPRGYYILRVEAGARVYATRIVLQ